MTSWFIIIFGLVSSWHYTQFQSDSILQNTLCPILVGVFFVALLIKCIFRAGPEQLQGHSGSDSGGGFFSDFGGGSD